MVVVQGGNFGLNLGCFGQFGSKMRLPNKFKVWQAHRAQALPPNAHDQPMKKEDIGSLRPHYSYLN